MGKIMRNGVQYGVDTADVLSTVAECDASASGGKGTTQVASAKALSELNSNVNELELNVNQLEANLGGVKFGIDSEGNYGYIKAGADTVIPFIKDINIGDKFTVTLTGSHNTTITASVCYIDKTTVCLLSDTNLGDARWTPQSRYAWNYSVNINGKEYTGLCRIPTLDQICYKCAGFVRDYPYWTSTKYSSSAYWSVGNNGRVTHRDDTTPYGTLPFIEITL